MGISVRAWWGLQRLHQSLMVAGVLLVSLVIAIVMGGSIWLYERTLRDAESSLVQLTLVIAEQVERSLESADGVLQSTLDRIADADLGNAETRSQVYSYLRQQSINLPQARSFLVVDNHGNRIIDSQSEIPPPLDFSRGDAFSYLRDHHPDDAAYVSIPAKSRAMGDWYFSLSRPLKGADGRFGGMLTASIDIGYFTNFFKSVLLSESSSIALSRVDGFHLLRYPIVESAYGRSFADTAIYSEYLPHTPTGVIREVSPLTGTERMLSFRTLKRYPLVVVIGRSVDEVFAPWRLQVWAIGIVGTVSIVGIAAFGALLVRLARREAALLAEAREARGAAELATKAAERASRAKSEFLAGISHDLRTPLNSIIGFSEVMLEGLSGTLTGKAKEYLGFIHTSGKHLLSLINDLLDIAKIEANRLTILDEKFSLHSVVSECLSLVAAQADSGRIVLVPYGSREFGLRADPVRLRQIIFNLLSNGIKFTPPGGTVAVRSTRAADGSLQIAVIDTGIGMTDKDIATALQPYGQVANQFTRQHAGTGLGLPLVRALAELHGGRIEISSTPGKGTTATVVFPRDRVLLTEQEARVA
jgi:two-component system cell cycle sensor histidine kinase PleC